MWELLFKKKNTTADEINNSAAPQRSPKDYYMYFFTSHFQWEYICILIAGGGGMWALC